jgi:hypothetical protein
MLRTNLSTRPFYNVRAVHAMIGLVAALVIAITLFNVVQIARLTSAELSLGASASDAEQQATSLRAEAARIRAQINPDELQVVSNQAREANAIIDQRAFSWTGLFAQFEATLPPDVRITAVQPRLQRAGDFVVSIGVEARRAEDLDSFIEALEKTGSFRNVLSVQEQTNADGLLQAIIEGTYVPHDPNSQESASQ